MKRYDRYKPSGIDWTGEIPDHWEALCIRRITTNHKQGFYSNDEYTKEGIKLLRITDIDDNSNINLSDCPNVSISQEEYKDFALKRDDFVFARSGTIGRFGIFKNEGEEVIFASYLIRFRFAENIFTDFLKFYFLSNIFREVLKRDLHGGANKNVHAENIKDQILCLPPFEEQTYIANYLDRRAAQIDDLIAKKQKLIDLLDEEKTAIIQAVTKGLNPDTPMKDSGIPWLGEIPEHWDFKKLKYVAVIKPSNVDKKSYDGEKKVLLCNYLDVYKNEFIDNSFSFMEATANENEINKFTIKKGDVLVTKDSETPDDIAKPAYIKQDLENVICGYHLAQIRANNIELIGEYLFRLFQTKKLNSHFEISANGITRFGLSVDSFEQVFVPLPPIKEQSDIMRYIQTGNQRIDVTISKIEKEIELLQEYRTALISEAVTGKIDVRI